MEWAANLSAKWLVTCLTDKTLSYHWVDLVLVGGIARVLPTTMIGEAIDVFFSTSSLLGILALFETS